VRDAQGAGFIPNMLEDMESAESKAKQEKGVEICQNTFAIQEKPEQLDPDHRYYWPMRGSSEFTRLSKPRSFSNAFQDDREAGVDLLSTCGALIR
jgi:hypothetical protein